MRFDTLFKNSSFYNEFGNVAIELSVFTINLATCFFGFNFCAKVTVFTMNSAHFSKSTVSTMNYALFRQKTCLVQKRQFLQWVMLSFSKTTVFTMNYALFFQKQQFTKSALPSPAAGLAREKCAAEPGRRPGPRKVRCRARPPARPAKSALVFIPSSKT